MTLTDEVATKLNREKQELLRKHDRHEISDDEFQPLYDELDRKIRERNKLVIDNYIQHRRKVESEQLKKHKEKTKMSDETTEEKVKIGRKPVKESYATYIEKALKMKTVKTMEEVVAKVTEWKPGKDPSALTRMAKVIINEVKKQKQPRWKGYTWSDETFLLVGPAE